MGKLKTFLKNFEGITIFVIFLSIFLNGCMQSPKSGKKSSTKSANTNDNTAKTTIPTFSAGNNFLQNGASVYNSSASIDMDFADALQLRGKDVDAFIRNNGTSNVACLTSRFTQASVNKVIVFAAIPRSVYNFSTQSLEYYYNLTPSDSSANQSFCQKTGLINQLYSLYPTLTPKYKMSEICPTGTCSLSSYASQPLELFNSNGIALTQIATKQLIFNVTNNPTDGSTSGPSCTDSSQCTGQGYSCCSSGQCVTDLALKPGVDTASTNYLQALQDILNNPSNIYLYPQYYFICSSPVNIPTDPTVPVDPINEANVRLRKLHDLYKCTTKIEGEYGICTKTYPNAIIGDFYDTGKDDRSFIETFTHLTVDKQTLVTVEQILFGEVVVYDYSLKTDAQLIPTIYEDTSVRIEGNHNDDLATWTAVKVKVKPAAAVSNELIIRYKTDASCTPLSDFYAKCEKYYVQGQDNSGDTTESHRRGRVTDHFPTSNTFKLPYYADISRLITVHVDGIIQKQDVDWQLVTGATNSIVFLPVNTLKIFKDQKVRITYYVDLTLNNVVASKLAALKEIKQICTCASTNCGLTPVKNTSNQIIDYACVYPDPAPTEPPLSQKIYLSSKTVPVRFFDSNGVSQKAVNASSLKQEGKEFKYRSDNLLNPSNVTDITNASDTTDPYTGFNEIYGSLSYTNGSAKPAYEVDVKKGASYDIYVDRGVYSNCVQCGNDYYSQLTRLFPQTQFGGGVIPLLGQTNRSMSDGIRSDELKFGRACLVPATMIPWTHGTESSSQTQRLNRMRAQHFLFANGYQYDWYGFDYGSVIGSFDGVKWFSIGSNRRIEAKTNKLFIAVNGLFGDLALESTYEVSINDAILNPVGTNMVTSDINSDGAQCQQFYQCSTDTDCATTLGWEYACASIGESNKTSWPVFDDNAKEIPEVSREDDRLTSILGVSSVGKRCVYRGRGALCTPTYTNANINATSCSSNNYCQSVTTNGVGNAKFNNKIVRYGKVRVDSTVDSFGLAALVPGRPYAFNGVETPRAETLKNINSNKIQGMCIPGRDAEQTSFLDQNRTIPAAGGDYNGDKVLGIGMTHKRVNPTAITNYLMSCSITDSTKNFYHNTASSPGANFSTYTELKFDAGSQAISSNALYAFSNIFSTKGISFNLFKTNSSSNKLTTPSFTESRCMRAPGASCFSDMDCAPSKIISDKMKSLSATDSTITSIINAYEIKFWQEELVCSQAIDKASKLYDPKNNRCCRAAGNIISLPSADITNGLDLTKVPGIDYTMGTATRYSRASTMYKEFNRNSSVYPELRTAIKDQCSSGSGCASMTTLSGQARSFAAFAEKTSCSGSWVRTFATGTRNKWEAARFQTFTPSAFQCMNWYPGPVVGTNSYNCDGLEDDDPTCPIAQTPPTTVKAKEMLSYLGRLELMGIPQIALESDTYFSGTNENGLSCKSHPSGRNNPYPGHPVTPIANYLPPTQLFAVGSTKEYIDTAAPPTQWFSAVDNTNFKSMKQVFKSDEVVSCYPAGTKMKLGDDPALCCTGMINSSNLKCQLDDYVDVSIYTNKFVSSEAKELSSSLFDQYGYLKDATYAAQLACEREICASGTLAFGVLISRLKTPGQIDSENKYYRFLEGANPADNLDQLLDLYNKGLKLNNHVYCVPASVAQGNNENLSIISCGN